MFVRPIDDWGLCGAGISCLKRQRLRQLESSLPHQHIHCFGERTRCLEFADLVPGALERCERAVLPLWIRAANVPDQASLPCAAT